MTDNKIGELSVEKEDSYVILPTTDEELIFAISVKDEDPVDPVLMYDGGEHALLYRSKTDVVILDYLPEKIKERMEGIDKAYIVEIDYRVKKLKQDYEAMVELVKEYPFDITPYM